MAPLTDKRVCMVACGGPYTVLATDDEQVWAFGANARGQLGLGAEQTEDESMEPMLLSPPQGLLSWKVELIACGYAHTVFLTDNLYVPAARAPLQGPGHRVDLADGRAGLVDGARRDVVDDVHRRASEGAEPGQRVKPIAHAGAKVLGQQWGRLR